MACDGLEPPQSVAHLIYSQTPLPLGTTSQNCGGLDSNQRPQGYEPCALPLRHPAKQKAHPFTVRFQKPFPQLADRKRKFRSTVVLLQNTFVAPNQGFEPRTQRLTAARSAVELIGNGKTFFDGKALHQNPQGTFSISCRLQIAVCAFKLTATGAHRAFPCHFNGSPPRRLLHQRRDSNTVLCVRGTVTIILTYILFFR